MCVLVDYDYEGPWYAHKFFLDLELLNSLTTKKADYKILLFANFQKMLRPSYVIENSKTRGQTM